MSKHTRSSTFIHSLLSKSFMSNPYELVSEPFYLLGSKSILAYGAFKSRIREAICNIRIIAGPDQGIKGIGEPKNFFHFY